MFLAQRLRRTKNKSGFNEHLSQLDIRAARSATLNKNVGLHALEKRCICLQEICLSNLFDSDMFQQKELLIVVGN